jgi:tight adherence protein C
LLPVFSGSKQFLLYLFAAFTIGFLLPKWVLRSVARRRRASVARELPLLVDLLGLLQGTGMSLDQTLQVIGSDFGNVMPVLSREIQLASQQYSRGSTRERSAGRMSEVYQNDNLANLTSLMIQIDRYGGAVQEPLRIFGERLREQRKAKMKELIGKISVKMTAVMVVTLLPALIIITAGPGFLAVIRALGGMTK